MRLFDVMKCFVHEERRREAVVHKVFIQNYVHVKKEEWVGEGVGYQILMQGLHCHTACMKV